MTDLTLDAPIVAVTVYPDRARITRRGRLVVPAGDQTVYVEPLPLGLQDDSVRVSGRGPATVLGVDVLTRHQPAAPDETIAALEQERRDVEAELAQVRDADDVQSRLDAFLDQLARRAGGSYARALATGETDADTLTGFTDALTRRLDDVRGRRRELAQRRRDIDDRLAALDRRLGAVSEQREPDRRVAAVALAVESEAEVEIELSYVVSRAGWVSSYDVRLTGEQLTLNWYGLVRQRTGEDWPECELTLSTARPAGAAQIPELDPWFLDRRREAVPLAAAPGMAPFMPQREAAGTKAYSVAADMVEEDVEMMTAAAFMDSVAAFEHGMAAASYTPARPVAVPADGAAHRATLAAFDLEVSLDHVTAPVRSTDVHLRATVTNSSSHTLPAGKASVFHEADFVGTAALPVWAPGEEVELALGLDDRIRVERELVRRTATKVTLGSTRRREVEYVTTIANHTPRAAKVTVLDQVPVSRDHEIAVRTLVADPEPAESTDVGELTWKFQIESGAEATVRLGFRVETGKNVELAGWRE
jgi:uncharacterized protein (TIGR02231 family)